MLDNMYAILDMVSESGERKILEDKNACPKLLVDTMKKKTNIKFVR